MNFDTFGLNESLLEAISYMNFKSATEIQQKAIPLILENKDIIGCAQTGTGKTAAFVLPTLQKLIEKKTQGINCLILVPTRELAMQIDQQFEGISYFLEISSIAVYGGGDGKEYAMEKKAFQEGVDVCIATPGRLLSHIKNKFVDLSTVSTVILDEADRMLDIGFYDDIIRIMKETPNNRQTLMFSATMAPKIRSLARNILHNPEEINLALSKPAEGVTQEAFMAHEEQKIPLLTSILDKYQDFESIIVFCSTKKKVEKVVRTLQRKLLNVQGISSDYEQAVREQILLDFRSKKLKILVATDVLSRGIDIKDINLVLNFDVPGDAEDYVHRVGRTARANTKGLAVTFINQDDIYKFSKIEKLIERDLEKQQPPQGIGEGPEWKIPDFKQRNKSNFKPGKKRFFKKPTSSSKG